MNLVTDTLIEWTNLCVVVLIVLSPYLFYVGAL